MQNSILEQLEQAKVANEGVIIWSKLPGEKAACLVEQPWKIIHFTCKKISDCMEPNQPAFTIPSQLIKHAIPLP